MKINVNDFLGNLKINKVHKIMFLIFFLIMSFDGFDMVIYSATLSNIMEHFSLDSAHAGFLASYALVGAAIGAFVFGIVADKIGRKRVIIIATVMFTLATFLTGMSASYEMFAVLRFITGLGLGGVMPNIVALATEYAPKSNRALITAIIFSGMQIGGILAACLSMGMISGLGWRSVYFVGILPIILIPLIIKQVPESATHLYKVKDINLLRQTLIKISNSKDSLSDAKFEFNDQAGKVKITALFKEHRASSTVLIWVVFFMNMYMIFGLGTWLPKLMTLSGYDITGGIVFLLTLNLGALVGSNVAGFIANRVGYKKTLIVLYLIAFVAIMLLTVHSSYMFEVIFIALAGVGFYGGQNLTNAYVGLFYPTSMRSTAVGTAFGIGRFGAIFGPSISGILLTANVPMVFNFIVLAIPGLISAICVFAIKDKYSYSNEEKTEKTSKVASNVQNDSFTEVVS